MKNCILLIAALVIGDTEAAWKTKSNLWTGAGYSTGVTLTKYQFTETSHTYTEKKQGYINRIEWCQNFLSYRQYYGSTYWDYTYPYQFKLDYGLYDMCWQHELSREKIVGNGKNAQFNSAFCKEITLSSTGECLAEVTFYRNDRTYVYNYLNQYVTFDYGIVGMAYKTNNGNTGTVGQYSTNYKASDYAASFSSRTYVLPKSTSAQKVSCVTAIDVSMYTSGSYQFFWNVGVKYNQDIPQFDSRGSGLCKSNGAAAGGGSAGAVCCLLCCGVIIYFAFVKGKEGEQVQVEEHQPEEETPEQPEVTTTHTVIQQQPMMMGQPMMPMQQPGMMMQQPGMMAPGMMPQQPGMMMQPQPGMVMQQPGMMMAPPQ